MSSPPPCGWTSASSAVTGFWYATAFVVLLWIGVLQLMPDPLIGPAMPYLLMADLAFMMFFIAGAQFFEKGERTVFDLLTTPLRFGLYLRLSC